MWVLRLQLQPALATRIFQLRATQYKQNVGVVLNVTRMINISKPKLLEKIAPLHTVRNKLP
jgi:hypothetical protein